MIVNKSKLDGQNIIMVPWDSIDGVLRNIHDNGNDIMKLRVKTLSKKIMLRGLHKRTDRKGNEIYFLEVPVSWYNWIKQQFELPI